MYLFDFIIQSYGLLAFSDVMLGDDLKEASKKLMPLYDDIKEKFSRIIPSVTGKLTPFEDRYMLYENIEVIGNPITSIKICAYFNCFPYSTVNNLEAMEYGLTKRKYMEEIIAPQWNEHTPETLYQFDRIVHMCNLLYNYNSYVGIANSGNTIIEIKVSMPNYNLNEATKDSVVGTYTSINQLFKKYLRNQE